MCALAERIPNGGVPLLDSNILVQHTSIWYMFFAPSTHTHTALIVHFSSVCILNQKRDIASSSRNFVESEIHSKEAFFPMWKLFVWRDLSSWDGARFSKYSPHSYYQINLDDMELVTTFYVDFAVKTKLKFFDSERGMSYLSDHVFNNGNDSFVDLGFIANEWNITCFLELVTEAHAICWFPLRLNTSENLLTSFRIGQKQILRCEQSNLNSICALHVPVCVLSGVYYVT